MCFGGEGNWGVVSFASPHKDHEKSGLLQASLQYPFLLLLLARWAASARALRSLSLVGLSPHKAHKKEGFCKQACNILFSSSFSLAGRQALERFALYRLWGFRPIRRTKKEGLCKQACNAFFFCAPCPAQCWSMFSINIPYPFVLSCTNTWVTAPTSFPFWIMGLPLMPWTIPPVSSSSSESVTWITRLLFV